MDDQWFGLGDHGRIPLTSNFDLLSLADRNQVPMLRDNQFSIGRLFFYTALVATIVACVKTGFPYGFIYPAGFVLVVGCYVIWQIREIEVDLPKEPIMEERDAEKE